MTPAEVLAAAADKLDLKAPGQCNCDRCQIHDGMAKVLRAFSEAYVRETRHFHAMWNEAARERMIGDKFPGFTETLALARLIIGGESVG